MPSICNLRNFQFIPDKNVECKHEQFHRIFAHTTQSHTYIRLFARSEFGWVGNKLNVPFRVSFFEQEAVGLGPKLELTQLGLLPG